MNYIIAGDVLINLNAVKTVSMLPNNVIEFTYPDTTLTEIQFSDYGTCLEAYKKVIAQTQTTLDVGGVIQ